MIVGLKRVFVLLYLLPFEVRGDGKHVGRYRHNRLPLASVVDYHREHTVPRGVDKTQVSLHCRINLSPFTKDFRGGELLRVNCIFGASAHSRATMECQKQREFDCLPTSSGRMRSWSFSVFAAFAVHASRLHIYLASMERQSFLYVMGSKHWTCSL